MKNKFFSKSVLTLTMAAMMTGNLFLTQSCAEKQVVQQLSFPVARFQTGDDPAWKEKDFDDSNWAEIRTNIHWERQGYEGYDGYAWYRIRFFLP